MRPLKLERSGLTQHKDDTAFTVRQEPLGLLSFSEPRLRLQGGEDALARKNVNNK